MPGVIQQTEPVAKFNFDNLLDSSGNNNHITVVNGDGLASPDYEGIFVNSYRLNGPTTGNRNGAYMVERHAFTGIAVLAL